MKIILTLTAIAAISVATFFGGRSFTRESFIDIPAVSAESFQDIPGISGAPQVVVYPDSSVGQWIVKIPTPNGDVFLQVGPLACPPAQSMSLQVGNYAIHGPAILNGWTNLAGQSQSEWKTLIHTGEVFTMAQIGGSLWRFASSCSDKELQTNLDQNPLPAQTWAQLNARGLAR